MDRRQLKTRTAIFSAFRTLLEKKRYDHITVQDIIDEANVGRSTFYSHFETKDQLLEAICGEIFYHVFENDPCPWAGHDNDLQSKLSHTLWHIRESKSDITGLLLYDSAEVFITYLKKHLKTMFELNIEYFNKDVPKEFLLNLLSSSFAETVRWWVVRNFKESPEQIAEYFLCSVGAYKII